MSTPLPRSFAAYIAPARRRPALWRLLLGVVLIPAVYIALVMGAAWTFWAASGAGTDIRFWIGDLLRAESAGAALAVLFSFGALIAAVALTVRLLHARGLATVIGSRARVLGHGAAAAIILGGSFALGIYLTEPDFAPEPNMTPSYWLTLLPFTLTALLIQTGAEEMVFRGYLQQQLAARFASRAMWMALPAVIFGLLHLDPSAGLNGWVIVGIALLFGLIAADLTAVTGSLGAAWGFHFANNVIAVGLFAMEGTITGVSLYTLPVDAQAPLLEPLLARDLGITLTAWLLCRLALRR